MIEGFPSFSSISSPDGTLIIHAKGIDVIGGQIYLLLTFENWERAQEFLRDFASQWDGHSRFSGSLIRRIAPKYVISLRIVDWGMAAIWKQ